ncbi:MAG: dehydrogenase [Chloroflexi bacterium]|nr:dehydrogenase [Chloroflexota bacterium]
MAKRTRTTSTAKPDEALQDLTREQALDMLRQMIEIRLFEHKMFDLLSRDIIRGASHLYAGQEAVAVGAIAALRDDDYITSTHRGHGHCHAHGDRHAKTVEEKQEHMNRMMAEIMGKITGYCKGKGGSMHIADVEHGNLGATAIVGGNIPVATGAGLAVKLRGEEKVVLCFFGEGAVNNGAFHEAVNMAAIWDLPVVYVCENNMYAMSVPWKKASKLPNVADRVQAYGIPGVVVDGQDVVAMYKATQSAVERARRGEGPTLIEAKTYRYYGHSRSDPRRYRTKEEEREWREKRDPIHLFKQRLIAAGWLTEEEYQEMERVAEQKLEAAVEFGLQSPEPPPDELYKDVYVDVKPTPEEIERERELRERVRNSPDMRQIPYRQALNEALREEMDRDPSVFLIGEDIGLYGGAYGVTRGLYEDYGEERVIDTPISEAAIAGACVGAAMVGMHPVGEIMYVDFTPLAMDQLANQGAKNRYMFGGKTMVPLVMRTEGGAGRAIGGQHSQSLEAIWTHYPGIYVVMPATPYDAKGLLKAAIRDPNPVMFIEHKMLYGVKGPVPEEEYVIPLGVADVKREGTDLTIVTYSRMVLRALEAAEILAEQGISVEVVDLRTLKPLDLDTVVQSIKKTGRFVGVTEGYRTGSFISEVMALVNEAAFDWLDAPMVRVAAADVPVPRAESLEDLAIPNTQAIVRGCLEVLGKTL